MSLKAEYRKCPKCKRMYPFNPDVGQMWCPHCGLEDNPLWKLDRKQKPKKRR